MQTLEKCTSDRSVTESEEVFTLRKGDWVAVCNLTSHASQHDTSWELRLFVGTPENELMAAYCDSHGEVSRLSHKWKTKLLANGWRPTRRETGGASYEAAPN